MPIYELVEAWEENTFHLLINNLTIEYYLFEIIQIKHFNKHFLPGFLGFFIQKHDQHLILFIYFEFNEIKLWGILTDYNFWEKITETKWNLANLGYRFPFAHGVLKEEEVIVILNY